jgi:hypothetical protein
METPVPSEEELNEEIRDLVQQCRARCLWFAPEDYQPQTHVQRLRALEQIQKHGDQKAFVRARELQNWLLRASSGT